MPRHNESRYDVTYPGADYAADEVEFILAMERYQRRTGRRFPTWHEVLRVAKSLGYRKVEPERPAAGPEE